MEIRAYDESYLTSAQRIFGDMMDYTVNSCGMEPDMFFHLFSMSETARQFERGNPSYVAGMTGCELARKVMEQSGLIYELADDEMYIDKSPEYWSGWVLAYYQWYTAKSFLQIHCAVSMEEMCMMYPTLHEADIMKAVDVLEKKMRQRYPETNLKRLRTYAGLSQKELSDLSGISIRQIQLFEQRQRDINRTQAVNLMALSRVLGCHMEDLIEL